MKILNIHGLNGSSHNTNYNTLVEYFKDSDDVEIISPQIDYENVSPSVLLLNLIHECPKPDIIVGNSFGGFFAYILGLFFPKAKTILVNPCIPPYEYIPKLVSNYKYSEELKKLWEVHEIYEVSEPKYSLLLGDADEVLDINVTLYFLSSKSKFTIIPGGHSLKGEEYENWFKEQLK